MKNRWPSFFHCYLHARGLLVGVFGALLTSVVQASPLTLQQGYEMAIARSEALQITQEQVNFAKGRYDEAFSAIFPQVNLSSSELFRNSTDGFGNEGGVVPAGNRRRFRSSISFTQPIFRGFREFLLADAAKFELSSAELTKQRRREELFLEVASSFEQLRLSRADLKILSRTQETLLERLKELKDWVRLGKSKASEISAAEAERADVLASIEQVKGAEAAALEYLRFFIGDVVNEAELVGGEEAVKLDRVESYVTKGETRSDVRANSDQLGSLTKQVSVAKRERWPAINLSGNYYPYQHPDSEQDWDISVSLQMPLFDSGRISARVSQQEALRRQSELSLQQLKRSIERDIRTSYAQTLASFARVKSLSNLVGDAERSYDSQRADYKLGIVTNLDVLQAIRQVEDAKRRLLAAQVEARINVTKLAVACGDLSL